MNSDAEKIRLIKEALAGKGRSRGLFDEIFNIVYDWRSENLEPVSITIEEVLAQSAPSYVVALVPDPREHVRTDLYEAVEHATARPADRNITGPRTKVYTLCDKGGYIVHGPINPLEKIKPFDLDAAHVCKKCSRRAKKALEV